MFSAIGCCESAHGGGLRKTRGHANAGPAADARVHAHVLLAGHLLDLSTVPSPDEGTLKSVAELRAKATLSADERAFLEYFELLEEIRFALGG